MFAVIKTGGRQYRVVPDDVLEIGKIAGDVGTIVQLGEVLVVGGDTPVLGTPTVAGATVAAEVLDHKRGPKVIAFKKRRRKNSRRKRGYRDEITVLRITEILTDNAKPSIGPRPKREKVVASAAEGDEAPKPRRRRPQRRLRQNPPQRRPRPRRPPRRARATRSDALQRKVEARKSEMIPSRN